MAVTDEQRELLDVMTDPELADELELLPTTMDGIETAVVARVSICDEHGVIIRPLAILLNAELFAKMTPPTDDAVAFVDGQPIDG